MLFFLSGICLRVAQSGALVLVIGVIMLLFGFIEAGGTIALGLGLVVGGVLAGAFFNGLAEDRPPL